MMRKVFKQVDLTEGKPWKVILLFALPIFLSQILGNAFSLINSLVLKTTVGGNSVTAINSTNSISQILFQFAYGCSSGFAIMIASAYGKKDFKDLKKVFYNGIYLSLIIGILITTIGLIFYKDLLILLNVNSIYLEKAGQYYEIILFAFIFMLLSNFFGNTLNALGDSSATLVISLTSTITNIIFAFLLTGLITLDTRGVAIATLIANIVNSTISFIYIYKKYPYFKLNGSLEKFNVNYSSNLLKLGFPLGLQWSILFIGSFVQSSTLNNFGNGLATKAYSCYAPFESYLCIPFFTISSATLNYVGQNYGTNNFKRIKQGLKEVLLLDIFVWLFILIIGFSLINLIPYIFMPANEINDPINGQIIKYYCSTYLSIIIPFLILQGILTICRSTLQGIQKPLIPFLSGIGELIARISICLFIPSLINSSNPLSDESYIGLCFSNPCAWLISAIIMGGSVIYFIFYKTKKTHS